MAHGVVLCFFTSVSRPRFGKSVTDRLFRTSVTNHQPTPLNVPESESLKYTKGKALHLKIRIIESFLCLRS